MMMGWDEVEEEDDDDRFFESMERVSSVLPVDLSSFGPDDGDEEFADSRMSFASAVGGPSQYRQSSAGVEDIAGDSMEDYNVWMMDPGSIKERRMRLLQGMGLFGNKEFLRLTSIELRKGAAPTSPEAAKPLSASSSPVQSATPPPSKTKQMSTSPSTISNPLPVIARSRSDVAAVTDVDREHRRKELLGTSPPPSLIRRIPSAPSSLYRCHNEHFALLSGNSFPVSANRSRRDGKEMLSSPSGGASFVCKIKNLDTGKEFIVNEDGTWKCFDDKEAGQQLTMEEFERCIGYSPIVKELMRRENVRMSRDNSTAEKLEYAISAKSLRSSTTKKKGGWFKNIKGVATSVSGIIGERDRDNSSSMNRSRHNSKWMKVRPHGKSYKEISGLYMSQEIQAHQGSIWCIKFSVDTRYLASAGEDRVIHVWQVIESEAVISGPEESNFSPSRSIANGSPDRPPLSDHYPSKRRGKFSSSTRKSSIPDYVVVPDTVFSLSDKPVCSFQGHLDDVLDLSWSKSQLLLSSSMDKTVRLWDMESKACLKLFAHNDYVTCIQFNPVDDRYFISGSLDAKVRIWSIPDHQVVDWSDLHEMVTAACYTPDGQGALVGSHKGSCRLYETSECKLHQTGQIDIQPKKKKSHAKKITGFQFAPGNASEVLITSADSQIRIFNGVHLVQKFRGFRNTSSQIAASFTADGKYIVSASEDSQVYVWKRDELKHAGSGGGGGTGGDGGNGSSGGKNKGYTTTRTHEHFQCRDVSVAIPWPGGKYELPPVPILSKRHHSRRPSSVQPVSLEDNFLSSRSLLPPLPRKSCSEQNGGAPEDDQSPRNPSRSDSGISCSLSFASTSRSRSNGSSSISASAYSSPSSLSSWSYCDGNSSSTNLQVPTAWGLALVTAGLGGEIKVYQNFGLPIRLQNQSLLRL